MAKGFCYWRGHDYDFSNVYGSTCCSASQTLQVLIWIWQLQSFCYSFFFKDLVLITNVKPSSSRNSELQGGVPD
ncbi:hypothetical protein SUGI_0227090 [Cryptomeria japonica]|nr:hypothetical protein SUGI_0227090 [Cryptomeria japonica]